jgi:FkbM family methyltransferase
LLQTVASLDGEILEDMRWTIRLFRLLFSAYPFLNGSGRIVDRTFLSRISLPDQRTTIVTRHRFSLDVFPSELIGRHLCLTGRFDPTVSQVLVSLVRRNDLILDIGANIGYVSCVLLAAEPTCRVLAVEPLPNCFELLRDNLARVGGERSYAICAAISDYIGEGVMRLEPTNYGASNLVSGDDASNADGPRIHISVITGEELVARTRIGAVDLIKIDVEGHEERVLRSLAPVIRRSLPRAIVFEARGGLAKDHPIVELLHDLGYAVAAIRKTLNGWRLVSIENGERGAGHANDYLARPRSHQ